MKNMSSGENKKKVIVMYPGRSGMLIEYIIVESVTLIYKEQKTHKSLSCQIYQSLITWANIFGYKKD